MKADSFVYCWTDWTSNKLYVGWHKGEPDDGYVCSSPTMLAEYHSRPEDFTRVILARGSARDMVRFEHTILKSTQAHLDPSYYNRAIGNGICLIDEETRKKMSMAKKGRVSLRKGTNQTKETRDLVALNNPHRKSILTPLGSFRSSEDFEKRKLGLSAPTVRKLCEGIVITKHLVDRNPFFTERDVGKNSNTLGWYYV